MTLINAIALARLKARSSLSGSSYAVVAEYINQGQEQFAKEAHGLTKEGYVVLAPTFDTRTHFAIRVTITGGANALAATDVAITATDRDDTTGTIVAADLQTAIRAAGAASATVVWSTTAWTFTIDTIDGTRLQIASPSGVTYADAMGLLFNVASVDEEEAAAAYTSGIPEDCAVEADLPSDYLMMSGPVEWDGTPLAPAPFDVFASPGGPGTPSYWGVRGKKIRLSSSPSRQGILHIWYEYLPESFAAGYQECGLSGKQLPTASGLAATTQYYFKVNVDGGGAVEYDITTAADVTLDAVIDLMNDEVSDYALFSLVGGDLRCTSNTWGGASAIALTAGTTGTDLFATLTGWTAFDTAVASTGGYDINIDDEYAMGVVHYAAFNLAEDQWEEKVADRQYALYKQFVNDFTIKKANANTAIFPKTPTPRKPWVTI